MASAACSACHIDSVGLSNKRCHCIFLILSTPLLVVSCLLALNDKHGCCMPQVKDSAMLSKIQGMVGTSSPLGTTVAQIRDRLTAVTR